MNMEQEDPKTPSPNHLISPRINDRFKDDQMVKEPKNTQKSLTMRLKSPRINDRLEYNIETENTIQFILRSGLPEAKIIEKLKGRFGFTSTGAKRFIDKIKSLEGISNE